MQATAIVFVDLVRFSKNNASIQHDLITGLTETVNGVLERFLKAKPIEIIPLPTGDGMALVFLDTDKKNWSFDTIVGLVGTLQKWAYETSNAHLDVSLRIGVHHGTVELLTDIGGHTNVGGHAINFAQRVMDSANPKQVLFSERAFDEYIGESTPFYTGKALGEEITSQFDGPYQVITKHREPFHVYSMNPQPENDGWNAKPPSSKDLLLVQLTKLPKQVAETFGERIARAKEIAFIQLTGENFLEGCRKDEIEFSDELRKFHVFMPDPEVYGKMTLDKGRSAAEKVRESIEGWKELFDSLAKSYPRAELKLGLFAQPPYLGASFIDWKESGGFVHVSPYIWGKDPKECPGYDIEWVGNRPPSIYKAYVEGLEFLESIASTLVLK